MNRIAKYVVLDLVRNKFVVAYTILLAALSWSVFSLEDNPAKGVLTLLNVVLFTVPLVSVVFSSVYLYNSSEFIGLLLCQPLRRQRIWFSLYFGLASSLCLAFAVGAGLPILLYTHSLLGLYLFVGGLLITLIFSVLAFLSTVYTQDKARGIGIAILLWLFFALLFDGILLFLVFQLSDYPIEKPMIALTLLNPLDLTRIFVLLRMDVSAMLGYTGAVFREFYGTTGGMLVCLAVLMAWVLAPYFASRRLFVRKDL